MSATTVNTNAQQQQKTEKEILKDARKKLDNIGTGYKYLYEQNKMRKKLKRWFDRCAKKKYIDAQPGELCYRYMNDTLYLGKRDNNNIVNPCLSISNNCIDIQEYLNGEWKKTNVVKLSYDDFYKTYRKVVGRCWFFEGILNVWDGFMSATQLPRQVISKNHNKAESVGGHVANIASRIFSPVIAPVYGLYAGGLALKNKLIPTEQELSLGAAKIRNRYKFPPQETQDNDNWELKKAKKITTAMRKVLIDG